MKVVVIGASGVIGQHLLISVPSGVQATFTRRTESPLYRGFDLTRTGEPDDLLNELKPDVVVNLAGENSVDRVEANPHEAYPVNVTGVKRLVDWCNENEKYLIHVSSQAALDPVNKYGKQKLLADEIVTSAKHWTIVRPTFVLGIRPFPGIGRENPAERILSGREEASVHDRYFSVSFAWDVADYIWHLVTMNKPLRRVVHVGNPERLSRLDVANKLGMSPKTMTHDSLVNVAPRPIDTTFKTGWFTTSLSDGMNQLIQEYVARVNDLVSYRAKEIAAFLHIYWPMCQTKLASGFSTLHGEVAADFNRVKPQGDKDLMGWYRGTEAYIWELTAYHCHPGFNYTGMCKGIIDRLVSDKMNHVLCLGDGTGDMSLAMQKAGMLPVYNDLAWSKTAKLAQARFLMRLGDDWNSKIWVRESSGNRFMPPIPSDNSNSSLEYGAVVSADFLEHMPNVEEWVRAIYHNLKPGGLFFAQNAFNCGSGPQGSIPMHLAVNDHFEKDWDPLLNTVGFVQESSNWYRKPL